MSVLPQFPPDAEDNDLREAVVGAASTRALAEVSEALEGLRELAARVQDSQPAGKNGKTPQQQLTLALAQAPSPEVESVAIPVVAPPVVEDEPVAEEAVEQEAADEAGFDAPEDFAEENIELEAEEAAMEEEPAPVSTPPSLPPVSASRARRVGDTLREARESAGFTLEEVAQEVKIKLTYLRAIEEGRYADLPARTYAVGFVRTYAQAMGLQGEEMAARCRAEVGAMPRLAAPLSMPAPGPADSRLPGGALMTICVVLAVLVYAGSYSFFRTPAASTAYPSLPSTPVPDVAAVKPAALPIPQLAAPTVPAVPVEETAAEKALREAAGKDVVVTDGTPVAETPPAIVPPSRIKLRAVDDTSVRIVDDKGHVLAERVIHKGEAFYVPDHQHYTLATTDAGALRLTVDGRDIPPLGDKGEAMHNIPLTPTDLLEAMAE